MKRLTAGVVAVATALSLSATAATAAEKSSSEISDSEANSWAISQKHCDKGVTATGNVAGAVGNFFGGKLLGDVLSEFSKEGASHVDGLITNGLYGDPNCNQNTTSSYNHIKNQDGTPRDGALSSVKSDMAHGWQMGTTADIAFYTGLTAAILALAGAAAVVSGAIPGLSLPQVHF